MARSAIHVEQLEDNVSVVVLRGEHDMSTAMGLRSELLEAVRSARPVVVELTRATFIDSSIIGAIISGVRRARETGTGFALAIGDAGAAPLGRTLELGGLEAIFPVFADRETAIAAARRGVNAPEPWALPAHTTGPITAA